MLGNLFNIRRFCEYIFTINGPHITARPNVLDVKRYAFPVLPNPPPVSSAKAFHLDIFHTAAQEPPKFLQECGTLR